MEEIRNAEALEKEIMDDARKRAEKVVRSRERSLAELRDSWERNREKALKEMETAHADQIAALALRNKAAVPLEQKRAFLAFAEQKLKEAVHGCFADMDTSRRDELLVAQLAGAATVIGDAEVTVDCSGVSAEEAETIVSGALPKAHVSAGVKASPSDAGAVSIFVATSDRRVVAGASTVRIEKELLLRHRERLARALLKGNIAP